MKKLFLVLLLVGAYSLSFSYDKEVFVVPGDERAVNVYVQSVNDEGLYWVTCRSELRVRCPSYLDVVAGKEMKIPIIVKAERGLHRVNFSVGDREFWFMVKSSNQTGIFLNRLNGYRNTFDRLESKYGASPLLENGKFLVEEGLKLYDKKDYISIDGVLINLQEILEKYYSNVRAPEVKEKKPVSLGMAIFPLVFVGLAGLYYYKKKQPEPKPDTAGLKTLLKKEMGGVFIGEEKDN